MRALWGALFFWLVVFAMPPVDAVSLAVEKATQVVLPADGAADVEADLVWAESDGHDYEIFISHFDGERWSEPFQITDNSDNDIVPAVIRDTKGRLWVAWSRATTGGRRDLYFKTFDGKQWSEEERIETGFSVNLSAALAVDRRNQVWLVWSSFDGVDDDIFYSRWNGAGWSKPMRVNADDTTPDIQPVVDIGSDGFPQVRWSGFEDGEYRQFESRWTGADWTPETMRPQSMASDEDPSETPVQPESLGNTRPTEIVTGDSGQSKVIPMPDFLNDPWKAGICIEDGGTVASRPLRTLLNAEKAK